MKTRVAAPPKGLSYADANAGRVVTIEDDVLGIKREIEERWPELHVYIDKEKCPPTFVVAQDTGDGERLAFERPYLDRRLVETIEEADKFRLAGGDPLDLIEAHNAKVEAERQAAFADQMGDAGERLAHALRADGISHAPRVFFSEGLPNR